MELDLVNNSFFYLNDPINRIKIAANFLKLYFETLRMNTLWLYFHNKFNYAYQNDDEIADLFIKIGVPMTYNLILKA